MPDSLTIDCHTHAFPELLARDPRSWAEVSAEPHWAELVAPVGRKSIQGWSTPASMIAAMDDASVDRAVLLGWYWENESTCRWHNEVMADWMRAYPGRLAGFAAIAPHANVVEQLEAAEHLGFCGVGELHTGVQRFDADSPGWKTMAEWCSDRGWPINLHVTEAAGHEHPGSVATPLQGFVRLAQSAPDLKIILAHWGGGLPFFEQNPKLRHQLKNVFYDVAASPLLYDISIFRKVIDLVGAEKVLFGSDFPLRVYPSRQKQPDMITYIEQIHSEANLSPSEADLIFGKNFARLIEAE